MKSFLKQFNAFDYFILSFGILGVTISSIVVKSPALVIIYSIIGILYVVLWAKRFNFALFLGVIYIALYITQSIIFKYWGEVIINAAFVLPLIVASICTWLFKKENKTVLARSNHMSLKELLIVIFAVLALCVGMYFLLDFFGTPYIYLALISFFLTLLANYMLMRRDKRMFVLFIILNVVQILIWLMPIIEGAQAGIELLPMIFSFAAFLMSNIYGTINWFKTKKIKENNET